jgi:hypothetical protein
MKKLHNWTLEQVDWFQTMKEILDGDIIFNIKIDSTSYPYSIPLTPYERKVYGPKGRRTSTSSRKRGKSV